LIIDFGGVRGFQIAFLMGHGGDSCQRIRVFSTNK